jgi:hypothetical protein
VVRVEDSLCESSVFILFSGVLFMPRLISVCLPCGVRIFSVSALLSLHLHTGTCVYVNSLNR